MSPQKNSGANSMPLRTKLLIPSFLLCIILIVSLSISVEIIAVIRTPIGFLCSSLSNTLKKN